MYSSPTKVSVVLSRSFISPNNKIVLPKPHIGLEIKSQSSGGHTQFSPNEEHSSCEILSIVVFNHIMFIHENSKHDTSLWD